MRRSLRIIHNNICSHTTKVETNLQPIVSYVNYCQMIKPKYLYRYTLEVNLQTGHQKSRGGVVYIFSSTYVENTRSYVQALKTDFHIRKSQDEKRS